MVRVGKDGGWAGGIGIGYRESIIWSAREDETLPRQGVMGDGLVGGSWYSCNIGYETMGVPCMGMEGWGLKEASNTGEHDHKGRESKRGMGARKHMFYELYLTKDKNFVCG